MHDLVVVKMHNCSVVRTHNFVVQRMHNFVVVRMHNFSFVRMHNFVVSRMPKCGIVRMHNFPVVRMHNFTVVRMHNDTGSFPQSRYCSVVFDCTNKILKNINDADRGSGFFNVCDTCKSPSVELIIADEPKEDVRRLRDIIGKFPSAIVIVVTATPFNLETLGIESWYRRNIVKT